MPLLNEEKLPEMKARVCVIGNSHVAALKQGWNVVSAENQGFFTFFASSSVTLNTLESIDGRLMSRNKAVANSLKQTSGGLASIDATHFDIFWLHGLRYEMPLLHVWLSSAVIDATCHDCFGLSLNWKIAQMLRELTEAPIIVSHSPLRVGRKPLPADKYLSYQEVLERIASLFSQKKLYFSAQPIETLDESGWATKNVYLSGSTSLRGYDVRQENISHMNAEFGKCWIEQFMRMIPSFQLHANICA